MSDSNDKDISLELKKAKILEQKQKFVQEKAEINWKAVAKEEPQKADNFPFIPKQIWTPDKISGADFHGKNLENGNFAQANLENFNFSAANLKGINLAGANLRGVDFSGADLTGANLEGADLTGANLEGAKLVQANLKKVKLHEANLSGIDLTDAIFLEIDIDKLSLEEIQELIEYLATYYPHKLNLAKFDLRLLDLTKIDLRNVSLRGVDFTGVDFTGVNIAELDLSECIITPEQIAQALGRTPSPEELKRILAPKPNKKKKDFFIDLTDFFHDNGRPVGIWITNPSRRISFEEIFSAIKKFSANFKSEETKEIKKQKTEPDKSANEDLQRVIEENKKMVLKEKMKEAASVQYPQPKQEEKSPERKPNLQVMESLMRQRGENSRG